MNNKLFEKQIELKNSQINGGLTSITYAKSEVITGMRNDIISVIKNDNGEFISDNTY